MLVNSQHILSEKREQIISNNSDEGSTSEKAKTLSPAAAAAIPRVTATPSDESCSDPPLIRNTQTKS